SAPKMLKLPLRGGVRRIAGTHTLQQRARVVCSSLPEPCKGQKKCRGRPARIEPQTRLQRLRRAVEVAGEQVNRREIAIEAGIVLVEDRQRRELAADVTQTVKARRLERRATRVDERHERGDA